MIKRPYIFCCIRLSSDVTYIYINHIPNVSTHWGYISTNDHYFRIYISNMLKENIKDGFLKTPLLFKTQELYYNKI